MWDSSLQTFPKLPITCSCSAGIVNSLIWDAIALGLAVHERHFASIPQFRTGCDIIALYGTWTSTCYAYKLTWIHSPHSEDCLLISSTLCSTRIESPCLHLHSECLLHFGWRHTFCMWSFLHSAINSLQARQQVSLHTIQGYCLLIVFNFNANSSDSHCSGKTIHIFVTQRE